MKARSIFHRTLAHESAIPVYHATFKKVPKSLSNGLHNVDPERLHEHLSYLKERYTIVCLDEYFAARRPKRLAVITFDDAYTSVFENALPILRDLDIPCTIFVNSATADGAFFWRDLVRLIITSGLEAEFDKWTKHRFRIEGQSFYRYTKDPRNNSREVHQTLVAFLADQSGVESTMPSFSQPATRFISSPLVCYGNHTHQHYVLSSLTHEQQTAEIITIHDFLNAHPDLNQTMVFAVPFGGMDTFNESTFRILSDLGYSGTVLSRQRLNRCPAHLFGLPIAERFMPDCTPLSSQICTLLEKSVPK